jgi:hypothetical protein
MMNGRNKIAVNPKYTRTLYNYKLVQYGSSQDACDMTMGSLIKEKPTFFNHAVCFIFLQGSEMLLPHVRSWF